MGHCVVKVCYADESGTGDEPVATMVGVLADVQRMHLSKAEWNDLLAELSKLAGKAIAELHTTDFYAGNGAFRTIDGAKRAAVISEIFKWLRGRKHKIVYAAVVKEAYFAALANGQIPDELNTPWRFLGMHLVLAVQRTMQGETRPKGHTLFVFDNQEKEKMRFSDLLARPPSWSDEYYGRTLKQEQLDQVVDTPYFGDSKEVALIQFADLAAFFLRRYAEIETGVVAPKYDDERQRVTEWVTELRASAIGRAHMYPKVGRNKAEALFYDLAPPPVRDL